MAVRGGAAPNAPHSKSVAYKTLVIHDSQENRWVCADLLPTDDPFPQATFVPPSIYSTFAPTSAGASIPVRAKSVFNGESHNGVSGRIDFLQTEPNGPTIVTLSLIGTMGNTATSFGEYHVHDHPVDASDPDGPCSPSAVGGHFNPLGATGPCNPQDVSTCEVGDISGKHGHLGSSFYQASFMDYYLPLSGPNRACLQNS
jgi:hypothetical protein